MQALHGSRETTFPSWLPVTCASGMARVTEEVPHCGTGRRRRDVGLQPPAEADRKGQPPPTIRRLKATPAGPPPGQPNEGNTEQEWARTHRAPGCHPTALCTSHDPSVAGRRSEGATKGAARHPPQAAGKPTATPRHRRTPTRPGGSYAANGGARSAPPRAKRRRSVGVQGIEGAGAKKR